MTPFEAHLLDPGQEVPLQGIRSMRSVMWGHAWQIGSAAYWVERTRQSAGDHPNRHRLGSDLREEVAACVIGGFGMPYELGLAAYNEVKNQLNLTALPSQDDIEGVLRQPLSVGGSIRRYRFPRQRAERLAAALAYIGKTDTNLMGNREMRDWLLGAPGIGLKTASWIVRNIRSSAEVAVLDIHVLRAGARAGVFPEQPAIHRQYLELEAFFLSWASVGQVPAGDLDAAIWAEMADWSRSKSRRQLVVSGHGQDQ